MFLIYVSLCALTLPCSTLSYTVFETNCTRPETLINYVSSANTRGTTEILWSCLFTIFACTWSAQHLNVPRQRDGKDPGWRGDIKWALKGVLSRAKWMFWSMIAPELVVGYSGDALKTAKDDYLKFKELADKDGVPWTVTHCFLANMGGFTIESHSSNLYGSLGEESIGSHSDSLLIQNTDSVRANKADDVTRPVELKSWNQQGTRTINPKPQHPKQGSQIIHLIGKEIIALREKRILKKLPNIKKESINDKSKNDTFARIVAITQLIWIAAQIFTRAAKHLAISQLEISVLAFSACAIITYLINLEKPKDIQVTCTLLAYPDDIPQEVSQILHATKRLGFTNRQVGAPIPNDFFSWEDFTMLGLVLGSLFFGAVHLAAWNFAFPTKIEQLLWRISSIFIATVFIVYPSVLAIFTCLSKLLGCIIKEETFMSFVMMITTSSYMVARLFMIVETFRTLCFLPPSAYVSTWASNVPHIS